MTESHPSSDPTAASTTPIVCDLSDAPDTASGRLAEYARFLEAAYLGRDRDQDGVRWLLRADPGIEEWARDLARRENACCAFMTSTVTRVGDRVVWHATTIDDDSARAVLDLFHDLPLHRSSTVDDARGRWSTTGVPMVTRDAEPA
jgi:hypothetical protein